MLVRWQHWRRNPVCSFTAVRYDIFVVPSELRPRGGGTLILTGSHCLISQFGEHGAKTGALRRTLGERDPWLADLWAPRANPAIDRRKRYLDDSAVIDGIPIRVLEVTGKPATPTSCAPTRSCSRPYASAAVATDSEQGLRMQPA